MKAQMKQEIMMIENIWLVYQMHSKYTSGTISRGADVSIPKFGPWPIMVMPKHFASYYEEPHLVNIIVVCNCSIGPFICIVNFRCKNKTHMLL